MSQRPNYTKLLSETIDFSRFPMILGILILHCWLMRTGHITEGMQSGYDFMYIFSGIVTRICVPLFFAISGFLFFHNASVHNYSFYVSKWKKRIYTLLIPYLLWNSLAFLIVVLKKMPILAQFAPGLADFHPTIETFFDSFWNFSTSDAPISTTNQLIYFEPFGTPADFPLWFLRDLIILSLLTPIIYRLVKLFRWIVPISLSLCFILNLGGQPQFISMSGIIFFTIGASLAILHINPLEAIWKESNPGLTTAGLILIYLIAVIAEFATIGNPINPQLHALVIIIGTVGLFSLFGYLSYKGYRISAFFKSSAFFIFAFHGLFSGIFQKAILSTINPDSSLSLILCYFGCIIALSTFSMASFLILQRIFPTATNILNGNRSNRT